MLYAFFWVITRRLDFICWRFGTLCLFHLHRQVDVSRMKLGYEKTSAYKIQTPGNYPKESIQHTEQGESLKLRTHKILQHWHKILQKNWQETTIRLIWVRHLEIMAKRCYKKKGSTDRQHSHSYSMFMYHCDVTHKDKRRYTNRTYLIQWLVSISSSQEI